MVDLRKKLRSGMIAVTPAGSYLVLKMCIRDSFTCVLDHITECHGSKSGMATDG